MQVCRAEGIGFTVAAAWEFGTHGEAFAFERHLKAAKRAARFCPCCRPDPCDPLATWAGRRPVRKRTRLLNEQVLSFPPAPPVPDRTPPSDATGSCRNGPTD